MTQVLEYYLNRGWLISVNNANMIIFREPNGVGWFSLLGASDSEKRYINSERWN